MKRLVLALSAVIATFASLASAGKATTFRYHGPTKVVCDSSSRTVTAYPTRDLRSWYGDTEKIYWTSDLYRYDGSSWPDRPYDQSAPWLYAFANDRWTIPWHDVFGVQYTWRDSRNNQILEHSTFNVPPGYYAIKSYFYWTSTGLTSPEDWAPIYNGVTTSYCKVS